MKHCVQFPDENILIVRPCLVAICAGNRPAAKLLGSLLFRGNLRIENKDDAKNLNTIKSSKGQTADQDTSTRIYRKQSQLVEDMCGEITEKTIHDVAVPWLQFLGYLDIQEFPGSNCYDVHFEAVQAALDVYVNNPRQLEKFLIDHLQLEKFLIDLKIEKFPIDKKSFLLVLEIILIANRNISNDKRGRKPASEGSLGGISRRLKNLKEITKNNTVEESNNESSEKHAFVSSDTAHADSLSQLLESWKQGDEQEQQENLRVLQEAGIVPFETPQGDDHAVPASGHSHRVGDTAACGNDTSHTAMDNGQVAPPENRPVLETGQEITEGEHHASRVPALPATNHPASRERAVSRPSSEHSDHGTHPDNGLSAVHPMGIGTPGQETAQTLAETPTTPMPAQSLSSPQTEQAALGLTFVEARDYLRSLGYFLEPVPAMNGNWEIREPGERGFSVICGDEVRGIAEYQRKKREQAAPGQSPKGKGKKQTEPKPETPKGPPVAPPADMTWGTRKCLMWFDFWRGGILIGKWKLMQASTCAKGLAEQFDEQTVIQARTDMEADPYYATKGGCDVCDVANNIHKYLKKRQGKQQSAIQPALKVVKRYSSYDDPNFRSDQDFYPVEGGSYATASV